MKFKICLSFLLLLFLPMLNLAADRTSVITEGDDSVRCLTDFDPNSTMITFYGDSLGDLIDFPGGYGYFGWDWYLSVHDTSVRWDIQNLAKNSNRTQQVYDLIKDCSADTARRKNFRTADNVALRQKITNEFIARGVTSL